ncbi:hypothetical protein F4861DRAFT_282960 [Xylaria intraflava]|nr:hypothetical protein F4861DRAFT_282960 [Xylaria intraflava]
MPPPFVVVFSRSDGRRCHVEAAPWEPVNRISKRPKRVSCFLSPHELDFWVVSGSSVRVSQEEPYHGLGAQGNLGTHVMVVWLFCYITEKVLAEHFLDTDTVGFIGSSICCVEARASHLACITCSSLCRGLPIKSSGLGTSTISPSLLNKMNNEKNDPSGIRKEKNEKGEKHGVGIRIFATLALPFWFGTGETRKNECPRWTVNGSLVRASGSEH